MTKTVNLVFGAAIALSFGAAAIAQPMPAMSAKDMKGMAGHNQMAMHADMAAMKTMDKAMMAAKGSTPDVTFARKMIAHHQGAIDMARIELEHGMDADAKRLAQQTIDENTKGIADLQAFLRAHGG